MSKRLHEQKTVLVLSVFSLLAASMLMLGERFYNNISEVSPASYDESNCRSYIWSKAKNGVENERIYVGDLTGQAALCLGMAKKKQTFKKSSLSSLTEAMVSLLFTLCVIVIVIVGLNQAQTSSHAEGLRTLEEGILRASVKCYAVEGRYPNDLQYIEDHYGLIVDRNKYIVHYEAFATNLLPDITVLER